MKEALFNVVTDLKLMVLIVFLSPVVALARAIAGPFWKTSPSGGVFTCGPTQR